MSETRPHEIRDVVIVGVSRSGENTADVKIANGNICRFDLDALLFDLYTLHTQCREHREKVRERVRRFRRKKKG